MNAWSRLNRREISEQLSGTIKKMFHPRPAIMTPVHARLSLFSKMFCAGMLPTFRI
jgi:hypothetical protein